MVHNNIKRVLIYGIGENCKLLLNFGVNTDFEIVAFIDTFQYGQSFKGYEVINPKRIAEYEYDEIFLTVVNGYETVLHELVDLYGVSSDKIKNIDYLNFKYMLPGIHGHKYIFYTDDTDYLNISYRDLTKHPLTKECSILYSENKWNMQDGDFYEKLKIFIFRSHCFEHRYYETNFFNYLKKKFPNSKFVILLSDMYDGQFGYKENKILDLEIIKQNFDLIVTYHPLEAKKYGLQWYELPVCKLENVTSVPVKYDLFFVGNAKNRLTKLHKLYKKAIEHNLKCFFIINKVEEKLMDLDSDIIYNQRLSYSDYVKKMMQCRCILDLCQDGDVTTLRYGEAILYDKKLLTNDLTCVKKHCYQSNYMKTFSRLDEIDFDWIKKNEEIKYENKEMLSPEKFLDFLEGIFLSK